ncbi:hypothetical protein LCGC14_2063520 [marine sediment metagenome]|uniref:Uncharacterized protein n=1 Tax=marine sediment metagenome TaxID=412755 RepID=A0A0F9HHF0_9ZZZZ
MPVDRAKQQTANDAAASLIGMGSPGGAMIPDAQQSDDRTLMRTGATINPTNQGGAVDNDLNGPGNRTDLPGVGVKVDDHRGAVGDGTKDGPAPEHPMSPQAAGIPGASQAPATGLLVQPGSDVRQPLVPGAVPTQAPHADVPPDAPGFGSRSN